MDHPIWAPDGRHLAFHELRLDSRQNGLYVAGLAGVTRAVIPPRGDQASLGWGTVGARWLPDSSALVAAGLTPAQDEFDLDTIIWLINPDTGAGRRIAAEGGRFTGQTMPDWSPDGSSLSLWRRSGDAASPGEIVIARQANPDRVVAPMPVGHNGMPVEDSVKTTWSPDGSLLAVSGSRLQGVWIVNPAWTHERPAVRIAGAWSFGPAWSPDGARLAYLEFHRHRMVVVHPDGHGAIGINLRFTPKPGVAPIWSPDGSLVAARSRDAWYAVRANGSGHPQLLDRDEIFRWAQVMPARWTDLSSPDYIDP
jgi:Tol biopolymer transport system component